MLADHSWPLTGRAPPEHLWPWDTLGGAAVAVFFVISGFLVADSRARTESVAAFLHKRALRVFPAFVVVCLACVFVLGPLLTPLELDPYLRHEQTRRYFANLTLFDVQLALPHVFGGNVYPHAVNGSTWTLPIEFAMYLALAIAGPLVLNRWRGLAVLAIGFAGDALLAPGWKAAGAQLWVTLPTHLTVKYGLFFLAGACAWSWRHTLTFKPWVAGALWAIALLAQGTPIAAIPYTLALSYSVLLLAALPWAPLTRWSGGADYSYGMYLYAFPVQQTVVHLGGASLAQALDIALVAALTLPLAALSWHLVERPALRLKGEARGASAGEPRS